MAKTRPDTAAHKLTIGQPCDTCNAIGPEPHVWIVSNLYDVPDPEAMENTATDGCEPVEPDGHCEHGHASVLLALGMI